MPAHEPWCLGPQDPSTLYRGDGTDEDACLGVVWDPADAARIVAEHNDRPRLEARVQAAVTVLTDALAIVQGLRLGAVHHQPSCPCPVCYQLSPVLVRALQQLQGPADAPR